MRVLIPLIALLSTSALARSPGPLLEDEYDTGLALEDDGPLGPACSSQFLRDGEQLADMPGLYVRLNPDAAWATPTMAATLLTAAEAMAWQAPDADPFSIGDISHRYGGAFGGHKSHRAGVDADIGLWSGDGRQSTVGFTELSPSDFDARTNWLFIRALLETGNIDRIYLDESLIRELRRYTAKVEGLSQEDVDRIFPPLGAPRTWAMTGIVQHIPNHRNHMHVRVLCEDGQQAR